MNAREEELRRVAADLRERAALASYRAEEEAGCRYGDDNRIADERRDAREKNREAAEHERAADDEAGPEKDFEVRVVGQVTPNERTVAAPLPYLAAQRYATAEATKPGTFLRVSTPEGAEVYWVAAQTGAPLGAFLVQHKTIARRRPGALSWPPERAPRGRTNSG